MLSLKLLVFLLRLFLMIIVYKCILCFLTSCKNKKYSLSFHKFMLSFVFIPFMRMHYRWEILTFV